MHVSDTAYWVATFRAQETDRADALFRDPLAKKLTGEHGRRVAERMKSVDRYMSWTLSIRTQLIDQYLLEYIARGCTAVINLGAGLDTRPYRLALPPDLLWIEADFPPVIEMKNRELHDEKPQCRLERIAIDLSDREQRRSLLASLTPRLGRTIVLTEGVIPYLTEDQVAELAGDLHSIPAIHAWIVDYYSTRLYPRFQSPAFAHRMGNAPFRFFPKEWFPFFERNGWIQAQIRYLSDEGTRLRRPFPLPWQLRLVKPLISAEKFAGILRLQAYAVLEKKLLSTSR